MRKLHGEKIEEAGAQRKAEPAPAPLPRVEAADDEVQLVRPWEAVARDGRDFAENGAGTMYWFKVPLGGLSYPEGFRHFLQPALENPRVGKIRFVLDETNSSVRRFWSDLVLPLITHWAQEAGLPIDVKENEEEARGTVSIGEDKQLGWIFVDLSGEFTPCFKLFVDDPDRPDVAEHGAQIFLSTAQRMVRFADKSQQMIRIPDAVLRVRAGKHEALLHALNAVANQWDSLF